MLDLAVGPVDGGAAVGVEGDPPAAAVNANVMMKLTQGDARVGAGLAAVLLVGDVVDVALGGGAAAAGPGAFVAVAPEDGAADSGGDGVGVADVQR